MASTTRAENQLSMAKQAYNNSDYANAAEYAFEALRFDYEDGGGRWNIEPYNPRNVVNQARNFLKQSLDNNPSIASDRLKHMRDIIKWVDRRVNMAKNPTLYLVYDGGTIILFAALMILSVLALWDIIPYIFDLINGEPNDPMGPFAPVGFILGFFLMVWGFATGGGVPGIPSGPGIDEEGFGFGCLVWIVMMGFALFVSAVIAPPLTILLGYTIIQERLKWYQ